MYGSDIYCAFEEKWKCWAVQMWKKSQLRRPWSTFKGFFVCWYITINYCCALNGNPKLSLVRVKFRCDLWYRFLLQTKKCRAYSVYEVAWNVSRFIFILCLVLLFLVETIWLNFNRKIQRRSYKLLLKRASAYLHSITFAFGLGVRPPSPSIFNRENIHRLPCILLQNCVFYS